MLKIILKVFSFFKFLNGKNNTKNKISEFNMFKKVFSFFNFSMLKNNSNNNNSEFNMFFVKK